MNGYALFFLVAVAIGGVAWVFIYPILSGERKAERRMASVARSEPIAARPTRAAQKSRREQVEGTLKEIEQRQKKARRVPLAMRISQAGLTWSKRRFLLTAVALGVVAFLLALPTGAGLLSALGFAFAAGCGVPLWLLSFLKKRRETRFLDTFPDAVDVIVRGIKAGLPLLDSLKLIATDAAGAGAQRIPRHHRDADHRHCRSARPVSSSTNACRSPKRTSSASSSRFSSAPAAISRKRSAIFRACCAIARRMKAKIQAMSMEAKASATIIGALPIAVMALVYFTSPQLHRAACGRPRSGT